MNGKRVRIWNCKDCMKAWQKLHTSKQVMKHRIWLHASVTHSTRWAWPLVDWGHTNTSIQWSTTLCHQVVFACAFGAVSTTQGEARYSNMETGAFVVLLSAYPLRIMDSITNNSTGLFKGHLSIMACKSYAITLIYLCWSMQYVHTYAYWQYRCIHADLWHEYQIIIIFQLCWNVLVLFTESLKNTY